MHRYERSGVVHGLTRVRSFCQDDAHIFCTPDQIADEISGCLDMLDEMYRDFGFASTQCTLSLRPAKKVGSDQLWDRSEEALARALDKRGMEYATAPGEGAFYGPKIDIFVPDAIGRKWQLGTVQLDFSLPMRFKTEYVDSDGDRKTPVVIHRALIGSVERFLGVLLEDRAGALPLWLAPVQVAIIPIADRHAEHAAKVRDTLQAAGIACELDATNERMGYKIRAAQLRKVPYMVVLGDEEAAESTVTVRSRDGSNQPRQQLEDVIARLKTEIADRS